MIIGTFRYDQTTDSFHGDIITLGFDYFEIMITPAEKHSAREPDYRITAHQPGTRRTWGGVEAPQRAWP